MIFFWNIVINNNTANFTAYINPYLNVRNGGEYTKHIYMGTQRISSKVSNSGIFGTSPENTTDLKPKYTAQTAALKLRYDSLGVVYKGVEKSGSIVSSSPTGVSASYFYHPDHLGSSSLITDVSGDIAQHVEYVPFGGTFIDERRSQTSWHTPFLFSGKERDEETGLLYVSQRYQDEKYGIWYSVDPLAEKFASWSSYVYCNNNPIRFIDLTGKSGEDTSGKPSEINKTTGVPTAAQSSVRVPEPPKEKPKSLPYTPPRGEIKDANKENLKRMHNEAMNDPIKKQCLTDPTLKSMAVGALTVTSAVAAPEIANITTQIVKEKGLPILYKGAQVALNNPKTTEAVIGVGIGVVSNLISGQMQDVPQITTGIPIIDNTNNITQSVLTVIEFTEYIQSGGTRTTAKK